MPRDARGKNQKRTQHKTRQFTDVNLGEIDNAVRKGDQNDDGDEEEKPGWSIQTRNFDLPPQSSDDEEEVQQKPLKKEESKKNEEQKNQEDDNEEVISSVESKKQQQEPQQVVQQPVKVEEFKPKTEEEARNYAKLQEIRRKREQAAKEKEAKEEEAKQLKKK